jgi:hypothetical protein
VATDATKRHQPVNEAVNPGVGRKGKKAFADQQNQNGGL